MSKPGKNNLSFLVLCGGQGRRMGYVNKPLLKWRDRALVDHVLDSVPKDWPKLISANKDLESYATKGTVVTDAAIGAQTTGPLVGILAGLLHCRTPWLLVSPGDSPKLPGHWWQHMCDCVAETSRPVVAYDGMRQQHLHLLLHTDVTEGLRQYLSNGGFAVHQWLAENRAVRAVFDNPEAFANFNRLEDLSD